MRVTCYYILPTYIKETINERVVARVAHGQPVGGEPDDVDVLVAVETTRKILQFTMFPTYSFSRMKPIFSILVEEGNYASKIQYITL